MHVNVDKFEYIYRFSRILFIFTFSYRIRSISRQIKRSRNCLIKIGNTKNRIFLLLSYVSFFFLLSFSRFLSFRYPLQFKNVSRQSEILLGTGEKQRKENLQRCSHCLERIFFIISRSSVCPCLYPCPCPCPCRKNGKERMKKRREKGNEMRFLGIPH